MKTNYHGHTRWCKHGIGSIEDYIIASIDNGIIEMAFTEHVPLEGYIGSRMHIDDLDEYQLELNYFINKYSNKIKIYNGFESEYLPDKIDYYKSLNEKYNIDFLILGHHFNNISMDNDYFNVKKSDEVIDYGREVVEGLSTGLFKILAHPDVFLTNYKFDKVAAKVSHDICKACEDYGIVMEFNANGLRNGLSYPSNDFFEIARDYNIKFIINSDHHNPLHVNDKFVKQAYFLANNLGLNIVEFITI